MPEIDKIIIQFKESHALVTDIFYSVDADRFCVQFLLEATNGAWVKDYIFDTLEPTEDLIRKKIEEMYQQLILWCDGGRNANIWISRHHCTAMTPLPSLISDGKSKKKRTENE